MTKGARAHGFVVVDVEEIPELKAVGVTARHEATGLEVFHILNDDEENLSPTPSRRRPQIPRASRTSWSTRSFADRSHIR
jgi:hypothetical protein